MYESLLDELRAMARQFADLEANLIALKELEMDSSERMVRLQAAEESARRASHLVRLQIDKVASEPETKR